MDPTGKYILTTRCRTGRSVRGFRLPPCCSFEERREIERVLVKGLQKLEGDLAGEYFPLAGKFLKLSRVTVDASGLSGREQLINS